MQEIKKRRNRLLLLLTLVVMAVIARVPEVSAFEAFFTNSTGSTIGNCVDCHTTQNTATSCAMCHAHGVHSSSAKSNLNLVGQTVDAAGVPKTSFAPGETVRVKITGGYRAGSARIILYDQLMAELARSSGADGMNNAPSFNNTTGITLSAAAPATPGSYTWNAAWYGNRYDLAEQGGTTFFGPRWTPDANNEAHGQEIVATNTFTVTAPAAPIIGVSPTTLAFGTATIGVPTTLPVTIANTGTATLNVTAITLGAGTSSEFSWTPSAPFTVAAGASATLNVTFTPTSVGSKTGSIIISSNDPVTPTVTINVSGTGAAAPAPAIALNPPTLGFGTVTIGASSTMTTQIQNNGTAALAVSGIALCSGTSTEFSFLQIAPISIPSGQSAQLSVTYTPANVGLDSGCIAITSNDPVNGTINLNLSGTGAASPTPAITLSPNPLAFGSVIIGTSSTLTAQIQSTGTAPLNVTAIALCAGTTAFSFTPITLPTSIPAGGNLPLDVTYTPATAGPVSGCINITSDAPLATLNLTGTGMTAPQPVLSVAPATLLFGNQQVGTVSAPQQVTIANTGTAEMSGVSVSSSNPEFVIGGTPTPVIAAGQSTTFTVTFAPAAAGASSAVVTVNTANAGSATVSASGTGTLEAMPKIALVPNPLAFGAVTLNTTSTLITQIQNSGTADLVVSSIAACGLTTQFGFTPLTLPLTIPPAGNASLSVSYTPTTTGAVSDCLTIASNDPAMPSATLNLTGTGVPAATPVIAVSPNPLAFNTVTIGNSSTLTATIRNTGTAELAVSNVALCAGTTTEFSFVPIAPVTILPGGSVNLNVTYAPTNVGADSGCLDISSNDPVTPNTRLNLTGSGIAQEPAEVDIDIAKFMATKEVRLKEKGTERKVNLFLWVLNEGTLPGSVPATLIGMQNGMQVYRETITVTAPSSSEPVMFKFPDFEPAAPGDITWTVSVEDNDADIDQATAVTSVIK